MRRLGWWASWDRRRAPPIAPCLSRAPASTTAAASPPTDSPPHPQQRRRRSRRANYADYDKVLREAAAEGEEGAESADNSTSSSSTWSGSPCTIPTAPPPSASPYVRRRHSVNSLAAWVAKRKLSLELALYQTGGGVGFAMSKLADIRAYTAYLHGSVDFFIRPSRAGPLDVAAFGPRQQPPSPATTTTTTTAPTATAGESSGHSHTGRDTQVKQLIHEGNFAQAALLQDRFSAAAAASPDGSSPQSYRGVLQHRVLDCVFIGLSDIHSRGLFTAVDLPRGTCVMREPRRAILAAPSFLKLLADTHQQLPDTLHYTHPTGSLLELVMQPLPHHFLNHSCEANVCCGLSPVFWEAAAACGNPAVADRLANWRDFADPNSFFTTRDVRAGEELTLDYGLRIAPMFAGENAMRGRSLLLCRCGSPPCRHFVYQQPQGLLNLVQRRSGTTIPRRTKWATAGGECFATAVELLGAGLDDETVLLSYLPSRRPTIAYLYGEAMPELTRHDTAMEGRQVEGHAFANAATAVMGLENHTAKKTDLLSCYRHVFKLLNEAAPDSRRRRGRRSGE